MNDDDLDKAQGLAMAGEWYLMRAAADGAVSLAFAEEADKQRMHEEEIYGERIAEERIYLGSFNHERDRRMMWLSAMCAALGSEGRSAMLAAEDADRALAEYDKRFDPE